mgnify:CR=1 FL=1
MKITCGCDIIEIDRIKEAILEQKDAFISRIYTKQEIDYCEKKNQNKYQHYAVRFAAKEAVFKALSCEIPDKYAIEWKSIELKNDESGRPQVGLDEKKIKTDNIANIDISISHCKQYAMAQVVVLWKE